MATFNQRDTLADLGARLERLRAEATALDTLTATQLATTPPNGGWSVAEVAEHLATSNVAYYPMLRGLIARGRALPAAPRDARWKPRFVAGILWRSLAKEGNKLPAPKQIRPGAGGARGADAATATAGPGAPADAVARYQASLVELASLLPEADGLPWNALVGRSPLSSLVRPNLGDTLMTLVVHCERHHRQIGRVCRATGVGGWPPAFAGAPSGR